MNSSPIKPEIAPAPDSPTIPTYPPEIMPQPDITKPEHPLPDIVPLPAYPEIKPVKD